MGKESGRDSYTPHILTENDSERRNKEARQCSNRIYYERDVTDSIATLSSLFVPSLTVIFNEYVWRVAIPTTFFSHLPFS